MLSKSYWLSVTCIYFIGCLESIRLSIGYNYIMELIGEKYRTFYGTIWNANEACIYLWATIYFGFIAKKWFPFVMIGYSLAVIATFGVYFYPESPPWAIQMKQFKVAKKSFDYIAKVNRKQYDFDEKFFTSKSAVPALHNLSDVNASRK